MGANVTLTVPTATGQDRILGGENGNPLVTSPGGSTTTDRSIGVTTTSQQAMPANPNRKGWKIKNDTLEAIWIRFGGAASAAAGGGNARIAAGGYMASEPMPCVETGAMFVIHAVTGTLNVTIVEFS